MRYVHIEDSTNTVPPAELARVAAALNLQAGQLRTAWRQLPFTEVTAGPANPHSWPIRLVTRSKAGLGVHLDTGGHPYAEVTIDDAWPITASHELVEMLVDPFGHKFRLAPTPDGDTGWVLVEVADPVEAVFHFIDGVPVSAWCGPGWYGSPGRAVVHGAAVDVAPHELLPGGYVSWVGWDGHWRQAFAGDRDRVTVTRAGRAVPGGNMRAQKDAMFGDGPEADPGPGRRPVERRGTGSRPYPVQVWGPGAGDLESAP